MLQSRWFTSSILSVAIACAMTFSLSAQELTINGDFEAGNTSDWTTFSHWPSDFWEHRRCVATP